MRSRINEFAIVGLVGGDLLYKDRQLVHWYKMLRLKLAHNGTPLGVFIGAQGTRVQPDRG